MCTASATNRPACADPWPRCPRSRPLPRLRARPPRPDRGGRPQAGRGVLRRVSGDRRAARAIRRHGPPHEANAGHFPASFCCSRPVSFSGFFQSANRAPFRSFASCLLPAQRASFQTARRTSSSASVAALTMCHGSRQMTASGGSARRTGRVIHSASSQDTNRICLQLSLPCRSRNFWTGLRFRPGCAHTSRPVRWSTTTVGYLCPFFCGRRSRRTRTR